MRIIIVIAVNAIAFWGMAEIIPGVTLAGGWAELGLIALLFTVLNFFLRPILKLLLGPVILITLGVGIIFVNMILLYLLDRLTDNLTIGGTLSLLYAALILGGANFVAHSLKRR